MKHFETTWQHLRRSPYQAIVAVLVISLTFYLASIFTLLGLGSQAILHYFETRPQVTAFFKDDVKVNQVEDLKTKLEATGKVSETKYISKEEALAIYKEQSKADPALLEMVTANILPSSLEVSAKNINNLPDIAQILKSEPNVEEVTYLEDVVNSLQKWTTNVRKAGIELVGSLGFISFLIVSIIIGMKVVLRKDEIEILRLIGATSGYVRAPFILEGVFYGFVGAMVGWGLAYIRLLYLTPALVEFLKDTPVPAVPPFEIMLLILAGEVVLGILIGILGSLLALRRYLK
ncbi:MAG: permease-like cell division protein FtsX [bacterium]|nr:permease-like cell division protein FtsX [bacterium]